MRYEEVVEGAYVKWTTRHERGHISGSSYMGTIVGRVHIFTGTTHVWGRLLNSHQEGTAAKSLSRLSILLW